MPDISTRMERLADGPMRELARPDVLRELLPEIGRTFPDSATADALTAEMMNGAVDAGLTSVPAHFAEEVCTDPSEVSSEPLEAAMLHGSALASWARKIRDDASSSPRSAASHLHPLRAAAPAAAALGECALSQTLRSLLVPAFAHIAKANASEGLVRSNATHSNPFLSNLLSRCCLYELDPQDLDCSHADADSIALFAINHSAPHNAATELALYRMCEDCLHTSNKEHSLADSKPNSAVCLAHHLRIGIDDQLLRVELELSLDYSLADRAHELLAERGFPKGLGEMHAGAFVRLNSYQAALEVARHSSAASTETLLRAEIGRNLLVEAFLHVSSLRSEHRGEGANHENDLDITSGVYLMAQQAESYSQLHSLCALPFSGEAETALLQWLWQRVGTPSGEQYPMYFLRRQQYHDALRAHHEIVNAPLVNGLSKHQHDTMMNIREKCVQLLNSWNFQCALNTR